MSTQRAIPKDVNKSHAEAHARHKGFIAFCETNLRYERGFKAWIFLGPYFIGALVLESLIGTGHPKVALLPWFGFLGYLILFPVVWRRFLRFATWRKAIPVTSADTSSLR